MTRLAAASGLTRRRAMAGMAAGAVAAGLRPAAAAAPMPLDIVGHELQRAGAPARLLGVAVGDPFYIRKGRPASDYAVIAEVWGANTVRISLHPGHWRADKDLALRRLGDEIAAARKAGLTVIVDWHAIGFPGRYTAHPDPSWGLAADAYDTDLALATDFWSELAASFGREPDIVFELWNEPVVDASLWVSTGEHWPLLKSTWLRLIEAIRRRGDALILVSGGRWAHDLKGVAKNLIEDDRVAYSWHTYPPADKGRPGRWFDSLDGVHRVRPVVVTEWGFCRDCDRDIRGTPADFGTPFVRDVLEPFGLHSTAWCWSDGAAPAMLEHDWMTATEYGRFVRNYLETAARPAPRARRGDPR